jgi:hypothetical protein
MLGKRPQTVPPLGTWTRPGSEKSFWRLSSGSQGSETTARQYQNGSSDGFGRKKTRSVWNGLSNHVQIARNLWTDRNFGVTLFVCSPHPARFSAFRPGVGLDGFWGPDGELVIRRKGTPARRSEVKREPPGLFERVKRGDRQLNLMAK